MKALPRGPFVIALALAIAACSGNGEERDLRLYVAQFDLPIGYSRLQAYSLPLLNYQGPVPTNMAGARVTASPDRGSIWVSGEASKDLAIIDTLTDSLLGRVVVQKPLGCGAFDPSGTRFLVCSSDIITGKGAPPTLSLVDVPARKLLGEISVGYDVRDVCFSLDGSLAYAANTGEHSLDEIDVAGLTVRRKVPTGPGPLDVCVDPAGRWLYVACVGAAAEKGRGPGEVVIHSLPDLEIIGRFNVGLHPSRVTPTPDGSLIAVSEIWMVDDVQPRLRLLRVKGEGAEGSLRPVLDPWRELDAGRNPLAGDISPDGRWFAVVDFSGKRLTLVDLRAGKVSREIELAAQPYGCFALDVAFAWHNR